MLCNSIFMFCINLTINLFAKTSKPWIVNLLFGLFWSEMDLGRAEVCIVYMCVLSQHQWLDMGKWKLSFQKKQFQINKLSIYMCITLQLYLFPYFFFPFFLPSSIYRIGFSVLPEYFLISIYIITFLVSFLKLYELSWLLWWG